MGFRCQGFRFRLCGLRVLGRIFSGISGIRFFLGGIWGLDFWKFESLRSWGLGLFTIGFFKDSHYQGYSRYPSGGSCKAQPKYGSHKNWRKFPFGTEFHPSLP